LQSDKVDKTRYAVLGTDMIRHDDVRSTVSDNHDADMTHIVANLEEQVAFLREVIRSRDHELRRREEEYREESRRKDHLLLPSNASPSYSPPQSLEKIPRRPPPASKGLEYAPRGTEASLVA
jgi:hypothetical protein